MTVAPGDSPASVQGAKATGSSRRVRREARSRATLLVIVNNQVRSELRPSNRGNPFQARIKASWSASSASSHEAEHPVAVRVELGSPPLYEDAERLIVSRLSSLKEELLVLRLGAHVHKSIDCAALGNSSDGAPERRNVVGHPYWF